MNSSTNKNFWKAKSLSQLNQEEWETLCDGCGKCCLCKIEYEDSGEICYTSVSCRLFDSTSCSCRDYKNRADHVKDCAILSPRSTEDFEWLPQTCAYRLIHERKDLPSWHHLVSGSKNTIHEVGMSVADKTISEERIVPEDLENYIMDFTV